MSSSSSTFIIAIGPSGSSQATIPLTTPGATLASTPLVTSTSSTMSTITSASASSATSLAPTQSAESSGSAASRTPNLGAIIGGTVGGVAALLWLLALLWWAHRNSWFQRPGYKRQKDTERAFGKRSPAITPTSESAAPFSQPPQPQMGMIGARTFGAPPQRPPPPSTRMSFSDPPRPSYGDPPRTNFERTSFGDLPRPNFGAAPPVPSLPPPRPPPPPRSASGFGFNDRPRSGFGDRSTVGFGDRPRSGFGDRPISTFGDHRRSMSPDRVRRFFGGNSNKQDEWEGAGRRVSIEPGSPEMEDRGGLFGFIARAKESAERRKRVKAEYEEDMRRMRGRSVGESDYGRF